MQSGEMLDVISVTRVEMYFSIFCLCPAAVLKKPSQPAQTWTSCPSLAWALGQACFRNMEQFLEGASGPTEHPLHGFKGGECPCSALPPLRSYCLQEHLLLLVETVLSLIEAILCDTVNVQVGHSCLTHRPVLLGTSDWERIRHLTWSHGLLWHKHQPHVQELEAVASSSQ